MKVTHIKWVLVAIVVAIFLPWMAVVYARESSSQQAIETDPRFTQPRLQLSFEKNIQWDPQSFLGRGRTSGFWDWSPKGVVLTPKGQNYFVERGSAIAGDLVTGKREISTIKSVQPRDNGTREVLFLYRWTELTDMAKLLSTPPVIGKEYQAVAQLAEEGGAWKVKSLSTPEFTRTLDVLTTEMRR